MTLTPARDRSVTIEREKVIDVTRLNGKRFVINAEQIKYIESTPDTMITLVSGEKVMVKEMIEEVVTRATDYCRQIRVFGP